MSRLLSNSNVDSESRVKVTQDGFEFYTGLSSDEDLCILQSALLVKYAHFIAIGTNDDVHFDKHIVFNERYHNASVTSRDDFYYFTNIMCIRSAQGEIVVITKRAPDISPMKRPSFSWLIDCLLNFKKLVKSLDYEKMYVLRAGSWYDLMLKDRKAGCRNHGNEYRSYELSSGFSKKDPTFKNYAKITSDGTFSLDKKTLLNIESVNLTKDNIVDEAHRYESCLYLFGYSPAVMFNKKLISFDESKIDSLIRRLKSKEPFLPFDFIKEHAVTTLMKLVNDIFFEYLNSLDDSPNGTYVFGYTFDDIFEEVMIMMNGREYARKYLTDIDYYWQDRMPIETKIDMLFKTFDKLKPIFAQLADLGFDYTGTGWAFVIADVLSTN